MNHTPPFAEDVLRLQTEVRGPRCVHKAPGSVPTLDNLEQEEEAEDRANS